MLSRLVPDVVRYGIGTIVEPGHSSASARAARSADTFQGRARAAKPAIIDGVPGLVFAPGGTVRVVFDFVVDHGRIVEIALIADPASIARVELSIGA